VGFAALSILRADQHLLGEEHSLEKMRRRRV
jgi:hypothetical protein